MLNEEFLLNSRETGFAEKCLSRALEYGAEKARATLEKTLSEDFRTLNGELDNVSHCFDRGLTLNLFVNGRYGSFSTNKLDDSQLDIFVKKAVEMTRLLAEDRNNDLPDPERTVKDAVTGTELGLCDNSCNSMDSSKRARTALDASIFKEYKDRLLISEEGEYSDSISDRLILDTQGLHGRHTETSFSYGTESTIQDASGNRYSGYWWDRSCRRDDLDCRSISRKSYELAAAQSGPRKIMSGKYNIVVDTNCASTFVGPIMTALNAYSLSQKRSFLLDSLGNKVFHEGLSIADDPRRNGELSSKFFDSEGVATHKAPVVENGVVKEYFVSTYMSRKLGLAPTIMNVTRPVLMPYKVDGDRQAIMDYVGNGILITDFNGGNSNPSTGAFSFGIQGFLFENGKIVHPVREMLVTGNFIELWNSLVAAGNDARKCMSKLIPTLAFENVDISA